MRYLDQCFSNCLRVFYSDSIESISICHASGMIVPRKLMNLSSSFDHRVIDGQGETRWMQWSNRASLDDQGRILEIQGVGWDITERKLEEKNREALITGLKNAPSQARQLSGMLPICASCKKIRDDKGYWKELEAYISEHSEAEFTHSLCPACLATLYPKKG